MSDHVNLRVMKRSRAAPERGAIFVMQLPDEDYFFGRVILADMPQGHAPMPGANSVYIYEKRSKTASIQPSELLPGRLPIRLLSDFVVYGFRSRIATCVGFTTLLLLLGPTVILGLVGLGYGVAAGVGYGSSTREVVRNRGTHHALTSGPRRFFGNLSVR